MGDHPLCAGQQRSDSTFVSDTARCELVRSAHVSSMAMTKGYVAQLCISLSAALRQLLGKFSPDGLTSITGAVDAPAGAEGNDQGEAAAGFGVGVWGA